MEIAFEKTKNVKLEELIEFQGNLKELSKVNFNKLWKSIKRKFTEPFSVWQDKKGKIFVLAGHQRLRVLKEMKSQGEDMPKEFPCNFIQADSKSEAKRILLSLASQYGKVTDEGLYEFAIENEFDGDFLKNEFEFPGLNLDLFVEGYFEPKTDENIKNNDNADEIPEQAESICKLGDLWELGDHRLLCGDCTNNENIKLLLNNKKANMIFTDPPYDFKDDFLSIVFQNIDNGHIFVMDSDKNHARNINIYFDKFIVFYVIFFKAPTWNLSMKIPLTQHLLIAHYRTKNAKNRDLKGLHSVIEISTKNDRSIKEYVSKRQESIQPFIKNFSDVDDIVLDLFGGSGSVLIACEELKRKAYLCELDPLLCDITIKRWENFTQQKAQLIEK